MTKLRLFLASLIVPCECVTTFDSGFLFLWRNVDASQCRKRGHRNDHHIVGSTA